MSTSSSVKSCRICGRELDVFGEPDSLDCGGDCYGCMKKEEEYECQWWEDTSYPL